MATHEREGSRDERAGGDGAARDRRELDIAWGRVGPETIAPAWAGSRPRVAQAGAGGVAWLVRGDAPRAGQSSLTVALALAWAARGSRVLVLDLDPAEDLARTLHVGWALRPGTTHTLAHALDAGWLDPAPSLVAGLDVASLGALPAQRPLLAGVAPPPIAKLLPRRYDRVLIDLPYAAGLPGLTALATARVDVLRSGGDQGVGPCTSGLPRCVATIVNAADGVCAGGGPVLRFPAFDRSDLGPWGLLTGAAGPRAEYAALEITRALDGLGVQGGAA